ncbi:porin [Roseateles sp. YR242]|uniref:porin n=1 Tax=Roseateles sp. YR242 TaxID=1855305 RepID=UPI000B84AA08|nr:porin [Roseateles sp. YR242]
MGLALLGAATAVQAQSTVTIYGSLDQYLNYMRSSSGARIKSLNDGEFLRSRFGVRGTEDLGDGLSAKFQLEGGLGADTGTLADTSRFFDRQTWVGLAGKFGEVRIGRQNSAVFYRGDYIDYNARTLGSVVNTFGVPSRFDNDVAYISPRVAGFLFEAHYALGESGKVSSQAVYQAGLEYLNGPFRVGYAGLRANPPATAPIRTKVKYDNFYGNYDYGAGKVYLVYIRSNNSAATAVSNNAGTVLGNTGVLMTGTVADVNRYYDIWQISADYNVTPQLRVGALWGSIKDTGHDSHGMTGAAVGGYYSLSKRTTLIAAWEMLDNEANGGFRPAGSAGVSPNFATPFDVNGRRISGVQLGILHRF